MPGGTAEGLPVGLVMPKNKMNEELERWLVGKYGALAAVAVLKNYNNADRRERRGIESFIRKMIKRSK